MLGAVLVLVKVWLIDAPEDPLAPVVGALFVPDQIQAFVPPEVLLERVIPVAVPVHIVGFDGKAVTVGTGLIVTLTE